MLFNSVEFLLLFLPLTLVVYLRLKDSNSALVWISLASLFFYGYWNPLYLLLILTSVFVNFSLGKWIAGSTGRQKYWITTGGVTFNLGLLGYFKYANFFVSEVAGLTGVDWSIDQIILPLAISFFTFQQIAYLVDGYQGKVAKHGLIEYVAFVTFFPQLIAGPIVHHRDMLPQFRAIESLRRVSGNVGIGITIFAIGLFKKVAIADELAKFANPVFDSALAGVPLSMAEAWGGALAYTFQLYFDFSGYSDMAIGLGLMFGLTLPINFASPYKARSIIEFWRLWHITLSNFLRDYLYIALGGNRRGEFTRYRNLFVTMLLGGLWHGAGWNFVIWGGLHGFYLTVNHLWRVLPIHKRLASLTSYSYASWILTFLCVVIGWVFFRAESLDAALLVLSSMSGLSGIELPGSVAGYLPAFLADFVSTGPLFPNLRLGWELAFGLIFCSAALAFWGPNVFDLFHDRLSADMNARVPVRDTRWTWQPSPGWALLAGLFISYCLLSLSEPSEFLYFQF
ncbi:MAG: MBOAT family protein [Pseudomonadota bacterium]